MATNKNEKKPCACCGVFHDPSICAQCHVAGCPANKKGQKCRLQGTLVAAMLLSEFQKSARISELEKQYAELLTESQRLAKIVLEAAASKAAA